MNVTALQEANELSPLLLSFSSPFLLRPVSPPACLRSLIAKQLVSLQQKSRLTFLPNLNRFTLELKKSRSNVCSMKETNLQAQGAKGCHIS